MVRSRLPPSGMQPELHGCCTFYALETEAVRVGPLPSVEPLSVLRDSLFSSSEPSR